MSGRADGPRTTSKVAAQDSTTIAGRTSHYAGLRVVILGIARQGMALARFMVGQGAHVTLSDMASADKIGGAVQEAEELGARLALGGHPLSLLDACDLLCLSGGVPAQIEIVQEAIRRGIPLSNDSLITIEQARTLGLGPLIAITGSSGKTTTTTLVGKMLEASGHTVHIGGNIGTPLIDRMESIHPAEPIVLELSSFQLELWDDAVSGGNAPHNVTAMGLVTGVDVAAITNVTPNHLDRHADMREYAAAKFNLLRSLPPGATVVLNADDAITGQLAIAAGSILEAPPIPAAWNLEELIAQTGQLLREKGARIVTWGMHDDASQNDASLVKSLRFDGLTSAEHAIAEDTSAEPVEESEGEALMFNRTIFTWQDKVRLRGAHNLSNILAAASISGNAASPVADVAATIESMTRVAESFEGVRHRLEIVAEANGVTWINDSIATSPERAVAGLRSFDPKEQSIILLAGGKDKKLPWEGLAEETLARVSFLIGFGDAGAMIVEKVQKLADDRYARLPGMAVVNRLDDAVELAARSAGPNTVVLLSPGGTSYDAYRDFEARGEHFRELVAQHAGLVSAKTSE